MAYEVCTAVPCLYRNRSGGGRIKPVSIRAPCCAVLLLPTSPHPCTLHWRREMAKGMGTFVISEEDWESYSERLDEYFVAEDITAAEKKRAILISAVGKETYRVLKNLCEPDKPSQFTYEELTGKLCAHFAPVPSAIAERDIFNRRKQREGETIAGFAAELRKLTHHCKYGAFLDNALRDRLVVGLADQSITRALYLEADDLTFEGALKIAISHEKAAQNLIESGAGREKNVFVMAASNEKAGTEAEVLRIRREQQQRRRREGMQRSDQRQAAARREQVRGDPPPHCLCCGRSGHNEQQCRFRNYRCHHCNRVGHLKVMCRDKSVYSKYTIVQDERDEQEYSSIQSQDDRTDEYLPVFL